MILKKLLITLSAFAALFTACGEEDKVKPEPQPEKPTVTIELNMTDLSIGVGDQAQLEARVLPDTVEITRIAWGSSDQTVASVTQEGVVTAKKVGTAEITAFAGGMSASCHVQVTEHSLSIGDFFYADGTTSLKLDQSKEVIGVVFWVGDATTEDPALKKEHPDCTHGLVVGLKQDATTWQSNYKFFGTTVGEWVTANCKEYLTPETGLEAGDPLNTIKGYNNTKAIEAFNAAPGHEDYLVQAVIINRKVADLTPAPESTSGWYLPSAKELSLLCSGEISDIYNTQPQVLIEVRDIINKSLKQIEGAWALTETIYWSSSEYKWETAFNTFFQDGDTSASYKDEFGFVVRPVLAF